MRARAAWCALWGLVLGACGFPDYGLAPSTSSVVDGGGGATSVVPHPDASAGGRGAGGDTPGAGGRGALDAGLDARSPDAHVGCSTNQDCAGSAVGPICDVTDGRCVECRPGRGDCPEGTWCGALGLCETGCERDADCVGVASIVRDAGTDGGSRDASTLGVVEGGRADASRPKPVDAGARDSARGARDAATPTTRCDLTTHTCTGCHGDADCPLGSSCSTATGRCAPGCSSERPCPTGLSCCAGECANLRRSATHCGACGVSCARDGGLGACVSGLCEETLCRPGFADCNGDPRDGCEANLRADPANCGTCASVCTSRNASGACVDGTCTLGACLTNFANCDTDALDGCEVNLTRNTGSCGSCGFACNLLNANAVCTGTSAASAACQITTCSAPYSDCDKLASTGCEVHTQVDPSNCGSCGHACSFPSADALCQGGACKLGPCLGAAADCNKLPGDGCEVNTGSDVANCGACAHPCALQHATPTCTDGACEIAQCDPGFGDCDNNPANGCETNLETSTGNCSACGVPCSGNHGVATCSLGACSIACSAGFDDCDQDATNGCETNTSSNVEHCGSCAGACSTTGGTPNCVSGKCGLSACGGTLADCNAATGDGCEVDTATDVGNCGGCGKACFVPNGTPKCTASTCAIASCKAGYGNCNTDVGDGCETRLNTVTDCGACGTPCSLPNANASCVSGSCQVASCITPYADCDGKASNGCETDTSKDTANCGGCTNACDSTNGTAKCLNGSCAITCNAGFGNCDALVSNGCERATKNDVANCGACGVVCAVQNGTPACSSTTCTIASCTAPFADCDHKYATGCESNTDTVINNCGACGKACDTSRGTPTCVAGVCSTP